MCVYNVLMRWLELNVLYAIAERVGGGGRATTTARTQPQHGWLLDLPHFAAVPPMTMAVHHSARHTRAQLLTLVSHCLYSLLLYSPKWRLSSRTNWYSGCLSRYECHECSSARHAIALTRTNTHCTSTSAIQRYVITACSSIKSTSCT